MSDDKEEKTAQELEEELGGILVTPPNWQEIKKRRNQKSVTDRADATPNNANQQS